MPRREIAGIVWQNDGLASVWEFQTLLCLLALLVWAGLHEGGKVWESLACIVSALCKRNSLPAALLFL